MRQKTSFLNFVLGHTNSWDGPETLELERPNIDRPLILVTPYFPYLTSSMDVISPNVEIKVFVDAEGGGDLDIEEVEQTSGIKDQRTCERLYAR